MDDFILSHAQEPSRARRAAARDDQRRRIVAALRGVLRRLDRRAGGAHGRRSSAISRRRKPRQMRQVLDPQTQQAIWSFREAALGLSTAMKTDGKAISFVEDTAVAPGEAARLHRAVHRHRAPARHHRRRLRARIGRLPARAAGGEPQDRRRRREVRGDRQRGRRSRARVRRRALGRARRRAGARRLQREDVRLGALPGVSRGEEDLRSERPLQSRPHRRHAADHVAPALSAPATRRRRRRRSSTSRITRASAAPSRCAAASGCAARSARGRCARRTW